MKICVFGAASNKIAKRYIELTEAFCESMAKQGHELVFGAGANGLMGAAARGTKRGGGKITGVIPSFFREDSIEAIYEECDELIYTETMRERKQKMEDLADAFVIVPGGIGTFEEMFEILTLKQLRRHDKPIALYNIDGYFDSLMDFLEHCTTEGFINESCTTLCKCIDDPDEIAEYILHSESAGLTVHDLKQG